MFYAGIYLSSDNGIENTTIVIIEKILSSARKLYRICDTYQYNSYSCPILADKLNMLSKDRRFIRKKKVFSQNKRPPKITRTPPLFIFASSKDTDKNSKIIRGLNVPIEALVFENNEKWYQKDQTPLRFGKNYYVNPEDIEKTLLKACKSRRLNQENINSVSEKLNYDLNMFPANRDIYLKNDLLKALSLPVWFCERVKTIKRY